MNFSLCLFISNKGINIEEICDEIGKEYEERTKYINYSDSSEEDNESMFSNDELNNSDINNSEVNSVNEKQFPLNNDETPNISNINQLKVFFTKYHKLLPSIFKLVFFNLIH